MGMHRINKMPSPEELQQEFPLSGEARQIKRQEMKKSKRSSPGSPKNSS